MNTERLKTFLKFDGWEDVEELFRQEILEGKKPINFKTDGKSNSQIAREVAAREMAAIMVEKVLRKLNNLRNEAVKSKEKYI